MAHCHTCSRASCRTSRRRLDRGRQVWRRPVCRVHVHGPTSFPIHTDRPDTMTLWATGPTRHLTVRHLARSRPLRLPPRQLPHPASAAGPVATDLATIDRRGPHTYGPTFFCTHDWPDILGDRPNTPPHGLVLLGRLAQHSAQRLGHGPVLQNYIKTSLSGPHTTL